MSETSLTSVVMVSYFSLPVIHQTIASVMAQTQPVELILVNNGNPPEVEARFVAQFKDDPKVRYLTGHGNIGFARACNLGARMAKGDRLLFLNPDCILPQDTIRHLYQQEKGLTWPFALGARLVDVKGHEQAGGRRALLTPWTAFVEFSGLHVLFPSSRLELHEQPLPPARAQVPALNGSFLYTAREDFLRIKGFNEKYFMYGEDFELCLRLARNHGACYFLPRLVVTHLGATSQVPVKVLEGYKAKSYSYYLHDNFEDSYPKPVLWALDILLRLRYVINVYVLRRT